MNRVISDSNLNMLIVPLSDPETESLEGYLEEKVVGKKWEEEFVCVVGASRFKGFSLISYGRYDQAKFSDQEKGELEKKIALYGREWLKENTDFHPLTH